MLTNPLDFEKPIAELDALIEEFKLVASDPEARRDAESRGFDIDRDIAKVERRREEMLRQIFANLSPWDKVAMARHPQRPYTLDFIRLICDDFTELHGDRVNADDPAIVGGLATFCGEAVVVIGHQKGRDLNERRLRNFGSARPSGFRKALRLMKMAQKFDKPILVFVDTPAAAADMLAEQEGISRAIAVNLLEMTSLRVPMVVSVVGEGGSGGALGIAMGDRVLMLEHAIYSVIPPESCAAILWKDRGRAQEAAAALKVTAQDALDLGVADEVIAEPLGGAHRNPTEAASRLQKAIARNLTALGKLSPDELVSMRYEKYRRLGVWQDRAAPAPEAQENVPQ